MKKTAVTLLVIVILSSGLFTLINHGNDSSYNDSFVDTYEDETFHEIGK